MSKNKETLLQEIAELSVALGKELPTEGSNKELARIITAANKELAVLEAEKASQESSGDDNQENESSEIQSGAGDFPEQDAELKRRSGGGDFPDPDGPKREDIIVKIKALKSFKARPHGPKGRVFDLSPNDVNEGEAEMTAEEANIIIADNPTLLEIIDVE